jgi:hypothetical protein
MIKGASFAEGTPARALPVAERYERREVEGVREAEAAHSRAACSAATTLSTSIARGPRPSAECCYGRVQVLLALARLTAQGGYSSDIGRGEL